jgi:hypothetical protein
MLNFIPSLNVFTDDFLKFLVVFNVVSLTGKVLLFYHGNITTYLQLCPFNTETTNFFD